MGKQDRESSIIGKPVWEGLKAVSIRGVFRAVVDGRRIGSRSIEPARNFPYYAFLFTLFYTGLRPSEAIALRVRSLDLAAGTLFVERSRSLRSESAPKTSAAARVVRLTTRNVEVLKQVIELRAEPDDYVFRNSLGYPIDQRSFYKIFCAAQRALGIRLRDLYATKDSYVSVARA